jgi:hypothetical protein
LRKTRRWSLWNSRHLCEGQSVLRLGWIPSGCHQTTGGEPYSESTFVLVASGCRIKTLLTLKIPLIAR